MIESVVFIPLTQGKVTVIDFDDFEAVREFKWHAHLSRKRWCARRNSSVGNGKQKTLFLHRFLVPGFPQVDHIDMDPLNNRRENLRGCTGSQNQHNSKTRADNTSGFKGVGWRAYHKAWCAQICFQNKNVHIGYFSTPEKAAKAYDAAAKRYFGKFARVNFPSQERTG